MENCTPWLRQATTWRSISGPRAGAGSWAASTASSWRWRKFTAFQTGRCAVFDTLHWDLPRLFDDVKTAIRKGAAQAGTLDGIGVDTWGVDFGLVGRGDTLLGNPVHYRDARTNGMLEAAFARVSRERIYEITGLQFLPFNTVYQLLALASSRSPLLEVTETLLLMPDLFGWLLTGRRVCERTNASTTQLLDPRDRSLVRRALPRAGPAARDPARADRGGQHAGHAATVGRGGARARASDQCDRAGDPRHRQCRRRRAGGLDSSRCKISRGARLVLSELGNLVAAGCRSSAARDQRGDDEIQLHE